MKIALFTKSVGGNYVSLFDEIILKLKKKNIDVVVQKKIEQSSMKNKGVESFSSHRSLIKSKPDFLFCVGGDGTFLSTLLYVRDSGIPIIGFNTGRLGFLANNALEDIEDVVESLLTQNYIIESRSVIELCTEPDIFKNENIALNDFTIHKRDNSSLTAISVFLNGDFFNTYWGDGIIVSTPTGSTAYSLSCGGPIVYPESSNFVITPVAPHNLNVRPVIVPDHVELSFEINSRERSFLLSLDSRYKIVNENVKIVLKKSKLNIKTLRLKEQKFSEIIREKLSWGYDTRNI
jgi:NAD+ kinase